MLLNGCEERHYCNHEVVKLWLHRCPQKQRYNVDLNIKPPPPEEASTSLFTPNKYDLNLTKSTTTTTTGP